jgi:hypothetical protein
VGIDMPRLDPGQKVVVTLFFQSAKNRKVRFSARVLAGFANI